jgi:hypothetical protein
LAGALGDPPGLPRTTKPLGWQPSRFLADRGEAERAFQLAEQLGSVNAAAQQLATTWPSLRKSLPATRPRHASSQPRGRPPARHRRCPPAQRPAGHPEPGPGVYGAQPRRAPGPRTVTGRAVLVGPPRGAVRDLGRQRGGRAGQRKPRPQAHPRAWAIIRRADRSHRLAGQRASRSERHAADRADRPSRSQQPQEREMAADAR